MFPGLNPKKMQAVMKQMGISQDEIPATKVIIENEDNTRIIISNPSVTKIKMQGQESFQITGEITQETTEVEISQEDIQTVIQKTGCTKKQAIEKLKETGDLAQAIIDLS